MCRSDGGSLAAELPGRRIRWPRLRCLLGAVGLACAASCSSLPTVDLADRPYEVLTDAGPVLVDLVGFSRSYSHAKLDTLVRKGMERAGRGQVVTLLPGEAMPARRMVLHVEDSFRWPVAQVTLTLFDADGKLVHSVSSRAPAPGAFPNAVFIDTVAGLASRLLPPAVQKSVPQNGGEAPGMRSS